MKKEMQLYHVSVLQRVRLTKTLHREKLFPHAKVPSFGGKELPNYIRSILPPMLSEGTTEELVFNRFHLQPPSLSNDLVS